jgi:hypothetical protein
MTASIVVTPGGSASIEIAEADMVLIPLTGNPLIERSGPDVTIRNPESDQALVLIARIERPASP